MGTPVWKTANGDLRYCPSAIVERNSTRQFSAHRPTGWFTAENDGLRVWDLKYARRKTCTSFLRRAFEDSAFTQDGNTWWWRER